MDIPDNLAT